MAAQKNLALGILGCFGGMFIHLIIGAYFQWGFINVYITSYYRITEPSLTLESNGIVFPLMQLCIAPTMKVGHMLASKIGAFYFLVIVEILIALIVFVSSYIETFLVFIFVFGIGIGAFSGLTFLIPLIQCNKYIVNRRMHVNGVILTGTGLGSLIFGQFVYRFINPQQLPSNNGYYDEDLIYLVQFVPVCLRYLSLLYLIIGLMGALMMYPIIRYNQIDLQQRTERGQAQLQDPYICPSICQSLKTPVFYAKSYVIIFAVCGNLLLNGNFKTYVQTTITDDNYLTLIGTIGSIGNAFCRFLWNMCFNQIDYRSTLAILVIINVIVLNTIRYTVQIQQLYCFMIFLANSCLGGFLVLNITHSHIVFGIEVGSDLDLFYWSFFSFSNFIGYFYVSQLSSTIGFNNIFYICMAMCLSVFPLLLLFHFQSKWTMAQKGIVCDQTIQIHQNKKQYDKQIQLIKDKADAKILELENQQVRVSNNHLIDNNAQEINNEVTNLSSDFLMIAPKKLPPITTNTIKINQNSTNNNRISKMNLDKNQQNCNNEQNMEMKIQNDVNNNHNRDQQ